MPIHDPNRQRKRITRLGILLGVVVVVAGGLWTSYSINSAKREADSAVSIERAREAFDQQDYNLVVQHLEDPHNPGRVIDAIYGDAELLNIYVTARRSTPMERRRHLVRMVSPLRQIVRLDPGDQEARRDLLDLLLQLDRDQEALALAQELTELHPGDAELLRYLGTAQVRSNEPELALQSFLASAHEQPLHVKTQAAIAQLLTSSDADTAEFIQMAEMVFTEHPDDPRAAMIRALASLIEGDLMRGRSLLIQASEQPPTDEELVPLLVQWLDRAGLYANAGEYLHRFGDGGIESYAGHEAVMRAFENGDDQRVLTRMGEDDPRMATSDLLASWAQVRYRHGEQREALQLINELDRRSDPVSRAWVRVLPLVLTNEPSPGELIDELSALFAQAIENRAWSAVLSNPYLLQLQGEAYLDAGEYQAAISLMRQAAEERLPWSRPHILLAQTLLEQGRPDEALEHAIAAVERQPNARTTSLHAQAMLASADPADNEAVDQAIYRADQVLERQPGEPHVTTAAAALAARAGRDAEARQRIADVLAMDPPAPVEVLASLADISRAHRLGLEQAIAEVSSEHHGQSPSIILQRASALAASGDVDAGRALIEQAMPQPADPQWQVLLAGYLASHNLEGAAAVWIALADAQPDNAALQLQSLQVTGTRDDTAFTERAIQRLRDIGGERSIHWRLEEARLTLRRGGPEQALQDAVTLLEAADEILPGYLDTQVTMTRCLITLGEFAAAEPYARSAKVLSPRDPVVTLLLGRVLHELGRRSDAAAELTAVATDRGAELSLRMSACAMLDQQGNEQAVIAALESIHADGLADARALLLLARLYTASRQFEKADVICRLLIDEPDTETIAFLVAYYEQTRRPQLAEQARRAAHAAAIGEADRLMLAAQEAALNDERETALTSMVRAAELDPTNPARWRSAAQMAVSLSEIERTIELCERGLAEAGGDPGMQSWVDHRELVRQSIDEPALIPLVLVMLDRDDLRPTAIAALRIIDRGGSDRAVATALAELADRANGFRALQELTADRLLSAGQTRRAFDIASLTMGRFPDSAAAARVASLAAYDLENWAVLINTAQRWAERNPVDRPRADLLLAAAQIELGRYAQAGQTLTPYIDARRSGGVQDNAYTDLFTRAAVLYDQPRHAWALLEPGIATSAGIRAIALNRIGEDLSDALAALQWLDAIEAAGANDHDELFRRAKAAFAAGLRLGSDELIARARTSADRLLAAPGTHSVDLYYLYGQIAQAQGELAVAEAALRRVQEQVRDNPMVLNNLAMVLAQQGGEHLPEAQRLAERATAIAGDDPNLLDTLAIVLLKRGRYDAALEAINRAIRMDPGNPAWRLTHADVLEAMGQQEQADALRGRYSQAN